MLKELSSYICDIAKGCIERGPAALTIEIDEEPANDLLTIIILNNINWQVFLHPSHKSSTGIPLLRQVCDICGGRLTVRHSETGSKLTAIMQYSHSDRPPLGSIPSLIQQLISSNPDTEILYTHRYNGREYSIATSKIKGILNDVPMDTPSVAQWIKENIGEGLAEIYQKEALQ